MTGWSPGRSFSSDPTPIYGTGERGWRLKDDPEGHRPEGTFSIFLPFGNVVRDGVRVEEVSSFSVETPDCRLERQ